MPTVRGLRSVAFPAFSVSADDLSFMSVFKGFLIVPTDTECQFRPILVGFAIGTELVSQTNSTSSQRGHKLPSDSDPKALVLFICGDWC